jgi:hypothetical protein
MTTTTKPIEDPKLAFGYRPALKHVPILAAWGARLIYPDDLVWDRTDAIGEQVHKDKLFALLNERAPQPKDFGPILSRNGIDSGSNVSIALYEDDEVLLMGSPQSSYGYFYVTGVLKVPKDER